MYEDCSECETPTQESMLNQGGRCIPCERVIVTDPEDGLPVEATMKLAEMAASRHPKTCNEDAHNFRQVLEENGFLPSPPSED